MKDEGVGKGKGARWRRSARFARALMIVFARQDFLLPPPRPPPGWMIYGRPRDTGHPRRERHQGGKETGRGRYVLIPEEFLMYVRGVHLCFERRRSLTRAFANSGGAFVRSIVPFVQFGDIRLKGYRVFACWKNAHGWEIAKLIIPIHIDLFMILLTIRLRVWKLM